MAREQLGVCSEANLHGSYLLLNVLEGHERFMRLKFAKLPQLFERLAGHFSEAMLTGVVAVGSSFWDALYPNARPADLTSFPELNDDGIELTPMPIDLFIQVRSDRFDVNVITCQQVMQLLHGHVEVQEHLQGFRYLDGRTLTGFIDAPFNPPVRVKRKAALIDAEQQPVFAAGSYLHVQIQRFDNYSWQKLDCSEQQGIMGYDKVTGKPLAEDVILPDSHFVKMGGGQAPTVLMQNMPFYQLNRQGLIQVGYAANATALTQQFNRRFSINPEQGTSDALLPYLQFELSAAFFAPSISFLELSTKV